MKKTSQQYLNSEAHGYLMEAKACKLLLKDLELSLIHISEPTRRS